MTVIDDARSALNDAAQAKALRVIPSPDRLVAALRTLIAEHERLQESARILGSLTTQLSGQLQDATAATPADRTAVERFADLAAGQFNSDLDYDGAEVIRRIEITAHLISPEHPVAMTDCAICVDDDRLDAARAAS